MFAAKTANPEKQEHECWVDCTFVLKLDLTAKRGKRWRNLLQPFSFRPPAVSCWHLKSDQNCKLVQRQVWKTPQHRDVDLHILWTAIDLDLHKTAVDGNSFHVEMTSLQVNAIESQRIFASAEASYLSSDRLGACCRLGVQENLASCKIASSFIKFPRHFWQVWKVTNGSLSS